MILLWDSQISVGDVLTGIGLLLTVLGLVFAAVEVRRNTNANRAQLLAELTARYFGDETLRRFSQRLDWGQFVFQAQGFQCSDDERSLDNILYTFDLFGRMIRLRSLSIDEARILAFQAYRVLRNPEVEKYLAWLDSVYPAVGVPLRPHDDARQLVERLEREWQVQLNKAVHPTAAGVQ
ncbi:MAG: hypothetical protein LAP85_27265 [Acidobacteriia bacterium]|nr:hypothetical protein [Terriglobia bacterium]